jgi:formylmethanofuran dehydrogenase subunit A
MALSTLASIGREYTFEEIAVMTRAAPARLLGLRDRGHLGKGAIADIAVYRKGPDIAGMLGAAALVFKNGDLVVKDGEIVHYRWGRALTLNPRQDRAMARRLEEYHQQRYGLSLDRFMFPDSAIAREKPFGEVAWNG